MEEGQLIQSGQQLFSIVRDQQKWITANYTERQLKELAIGKDVQITVDAMPNRIFKGKISAISEATGSKYASIPVDNSTGNFIKVQQRIPVRIDFSQQNDTKELEKLLVGMNVVVKAI